MSVFSHSEFDPESSKVPSSGRRATRVERRFQHIRDCLHKYLSAIMVDSCLKQAMKRRAIDRPRTPSDLEGIVEEVMVGLRLFVAADRLPQLMLELTDLLAEDE
jgi:hypothetical protein